MGSNPAIPTAKAVRFGSGRPCLWRLGPCRLDVLRQAAWSFGSGSLPAKSGKKFEVSGRYRCHGGQAVMWEERFRAPRMTLPEWALHAPGRCVLKSSESGTWEVYAWDAAAGTRRQVTSRPHGTYLTAVDPAGEEIWWFADQDGDEFGIWMVEPFDGSSPAVPAAAELAAGYPTGLGFGPAGLAFAGRVDDAGTELWLIDRTADGDAGRPARLVYSSREDAAAGDISPDGSLLAFSHSEHGDSRHPALRVVRLDGSTVADLWDGPGKGLAVEGFSPVDNRLLVGHERRGRPSVLIWDPETGATDELGLDLPGEVDGSWYPDGSALLLAHQVRARTEIYRYELTTRRLQRLDTPAGVIAAADRAAGRRGVAVVQLRRAPAPGARLGRRSGHRPGGRGAAARCALRRRGRPGAGRDDSRPAGAARAGAALSRRLPPARRARKPTTRTATHRRSPRSSMPDTRWSA